MEGDGCFVDESIVVHIGWKYMASRILISDAGLTRIVVGFLLAPGFNAHFFFMYSVKKAEGYKVNFRNMTGHDMT